MKNKVIKRFLIIILIIIGSLFYYKEYNYENKVVVQEKNESEIIEEESKETEIEGTLKINEENQNKIMNILFLGIDEEEAVSDTIMILSLNEENKTLKLVSIMRDTYIHQGEGKANKINYAYHYGGVQGSIDTINSVFNLDISKYVKVDFKGLVSIVNYLGGVKVNISEDERKSINAKCTEDRLNKSGSVILNGDQALAFSRLRWIDSDFERTERQRKIMIGIFHKMKDMDTVKFPKAIYTLSRSSESNLSMIELLELGSVIYKYDDSDLREFRIPIDGTTSHSTSGVYHLNWNEEVNKKALHDFIYG